MNDVDDTSTDELVEQLRRTALICDGTDADLLNASANRLNALYYATTDLPKRQPWVACHDCGLPYGDDGWCDCVVPNDVWRLVSPAGDEGGILCLHCIARRLVRLGLRDVPLAVTSGPFRQTDRPRVRKNMGMFDSIFVRCPVCDAAFEVQSKSGDCRMYVYGADLVPRSAARGIVGTAVECQWCGEQLVIEGMVGHEPYSQIRAVERT